MRENGYDRIRKTKGEQAKICSETDEEAIIIQIVHKDETGRTKQNIRLTIFWRNGGRENGPSRTESIGLGPQFMWFGNRV